jgi:hypothetical protein
MAQWKVARFALILAACHGGPASPNVESPWGFDTQLSPDEITEGVFISVPGQLVSVEQGTELERAWMRAHLTAGTDRVAISDGAILVVSAADGPMPQVDPDGETLSIVVRSALVDAAGVIRFDGIGTLTTGRVVSPPFEITGTARPSAAPSFSPPPLPTPPPFIDPNPPSPAPDYPDYIVWELVGGNLQPTLTFTTRSTVRPR